MTIWVYNKLILETPVMWLETLELERDKGIKNRKINYKIEKTVWEVTIFL